MNAKKLLALSLACTLTLGLSACGGGQDAPSSSSPSGASDGDALKVGIILSTGGLGDKNFNDMTYAGAQQAEKDFGIEFDYVETQSASDFLPNYRMFAESGEYDLIIGLAADQTEAINEISIDFPEQKISHIDSSTDLPNVSAVYTKWQEQTFLTGVVAGLGTLSGIDKANSENVGGVILGQDQPTLRMGVVGFEAGVRYVNPDCEVLEAVVGDFNDPAKAKEIALSMYNRGADFVQHIAGASGMGVFTAAKEADRYAFGVGGNQNYIEPDYIVATALRDVNTIVYNEIKALVEGTWEPGVHISGIAEGSVGFDNTDSNVVLPDDIAAALDEAIERLAGDETMLRIHDGSAVINVPLSQVRSITADGHYLNLSTANGPLRWRQSFGRLADMVAPYPQLFACNRGIMVNLAHVDDLTDDGCFLMDDGSKLPVRRSSRAEARSRYFDYLFTHVRR